MRYSHHPLTPELETPEFYNQVYFIQLRTAINWKARPDYAT